MIRHLFIAGASGDLTTRYLGPAIAALHVEGELPDQFSVVGMARSEMSDEAFRESIAEGLEEHVPDLGQDQRDAVVETFSYREADVTDPDDLRAALEGVDEPVAMYLALPASILKAAIEALIDVDLPDESRILVEKPFGEDLASARELNELLHEALPESAVFRIDHFVAEQSVQNVPALRFANRTWEPLWNREHIERVEVTWDETLALEDRAGYYDSAGALRDMVQNHLLQVMAVVAMEPTSGKSSDDGIGGDIRGRKVELLRAVVPPEGDEVAERTVRARYTAGEVDGREVPSYVDEEGVEASNGTETFAEVELRVDNDRWRDVPFVLRTGKALGADRAEVVVRFRPTSSGGSQILRLGFNPPTVELSTWSAGPAGPSNLHEVTAVAEVAASRLPPYGRLLLDALNGETSLSIRDDEAEESWRIVQPIMDAWSDGRVPLREYAAGSQGPGA